MISKADLDLLPIGTKIEYLSYTNVKYVNKDDNYVYMEDKNGNKKHVYIGLFCKYAVLGLEAK